MEDIETAKDLENFIRKNYAVSYDELIKNVALSKDELDKLLKDLTQNDKILKKVKNDIYYISNDGIEVDDFDHAYRVFGEVVIKMKEMNINYKTEIGSLKKDIKHFYINIITIMGIFVAVFSLIFTNMNQIPIVAANPTLSAIGTCAIIDISAIIIIAAILFLIKRIILSSDTKK